MDTIAIVALITIVGIAVGIVCIGCNRSFSLICCGTGIKPGWFTYSILRLYMKTNDSKCVSVNVCGG